MEVVRSSTSVAVAHYTPCTVVMVPLSLNRLIQRRQSNHRTSTRSSSRYLPEEFDQPMQLVVQDHHDFGQEVLRSRRKLLLCRVGLNNTLVAFDQNRQEDVDLPSKHMSEVSSLAGYQNGRVLQPVFGRQPLCSNAERSRPRLIEAAWG